MKAQEDGGPIGKGSRRPLRLCATGKRHSPFHVCVRSKRNRRQQIAGGGNVGLDAGVRPLGQCRLRKKPVDHCRSDGLLPPIHGSHPSHSIAPDTNFDAHFL